MSEVKLDLVAFDRSGEWGEVVLLEQGWTGPAEPHLRALQDRLYDCLDAILRGGFAAEFPQSVGNWIRIHIRCDPAYQHDVDQFIGRFARAVRTFPDWSATGSPYVSDIRFSVNDRALALE
ncbi:MAG TPA: hypothetical protein VG960_04985 [Caulobacteraceae bacterium]|nr:hypothetical protein [Caulobacteraceae bacterium]